MIHVHDNKRDLFTDDGGKIHRVTVIQEALVDDEEDYIMYA